tara:strand:+ start:6560 stop:7651 length:1092 start_codon:yes stop_codon:yes gene_type:complete
VIVVGIPTYNEADNIARLTHQVDAAALALGISITIVNADSASVDETSEVFLGTPTHCPKVSIKNSEKGKGRNIATILQWVVEASEADGCVLIDGDVTSFEPEWLARHTELLLNDADYTIPTYSRNYQEGNTTNHFVYPLVGVHSSGKAPRQPISGDFGISRRFAKHLIKQQWHEYTWGYGIDIFMTLHALYGSFNVAEVLLSKKVHKPSFDKMIPMFTEVAASYYATMRLLKDTYAGKVHLTTIKRAPELIATTPLSTAKITERRVVAQKVYDESKENSCVPELDAMFCNEVGFMQWAQILIAHELKIATVDPLVLARSILPWYLLRVVFYLQKNKTPLHATREIDKQFQYVVKLWQYEAHSH